MRLILPPTSRLQPYVAYLWVGERPRAGAREQVLPTGAMHLAVRLQGGPIRLYDERDAAIARTSDDALVAGARAGCYWKDASVPTRTVGAQLRPGAARALFGVSASEFSGLHVPLRDAWGQRGLRLCEVLSEARDPHAQLAALEAALLARLAPTPRGMHPAVAQALAQMRAAPAAERLPAVSGISQRHFIAQFRDATGLSPKRYARLCRFQHLLRAMEKQEACRLADLAAAAGYSDQSHCNREFLAFAGITPHAWRLRQRAQAMASSSRRHLGSIPSKTPA